MWLSKLLSRESPEEVMTNNLEPSGFHSLTPAEKLGGVRYAKAQAEGKHIVEQITEMVCEGLPVDLPSVRCVVAARRRLSLFRGDTKTFRAEFAERGRTPDGSQSWLIRNVQLFGVEFGILADHLWITPSLAITRQVSPLQGDVLVIHARVASYRHAPFTTQGQRSVAVSERCCLDPILSLRVLCRPRRK